MPKVLIVEDEPGLLEGLAHNFKFEGYEVVTAADGKEGLKLALKERPDLIVLDLMLPEKDGFEVLREYRQRNATSPVLILTARSLESDLIQGFDLGADDYLTKPFSVRELLARIRSLLRRAGEAPGRQSPARFRFGDIEVDFKRQKATRAGRDLDLSAREFRILSYFIEHRGEMLSREQLLNDIWGYEVFPTTRTVDNHIARLRKKIEDEPDNPRWIRTQRGAGYIFEAEPKR